MNKFKMFIREYPDYNDPDYIGRQTICDSYDHFLFCVSNLNECPEDAIIGRDLFTADDYIEAVKFGMKLRADGYDDIEVINVDIREEED